MSQMLAEKSCLHRHTDAIQILLWMKQDDSLTFPYTQYGVYATVDLRKTILSIPLVHTQPHTIAEVGNFTDLFKQAGIVALIFSSPNQSSSITKFDAQLGLVAKNLLLSVVQTSSLCASLYMLVH